MELLGHLFYFVLCSALIIIAWMVFLFFNNLIDQIQSSVIQGFWGSVNTVVLLAAIGIIVYYYAFSFFSGVLLIMILAFLIYAIKKAVTGTTLVKR